jgi:hypothetical protein
MKKYMILFALLILVIGAIAQTATVTTVIDPNAIPVGGGWPEWTSWAIVVLLTLWEIVLRLVPTAKDWTLVSKIVTILNWIVSLINGIGNAAKTPAGKKAAFKNTKVEL